MLFDQFLITSLILKNRIVRSATYEKRADDDGFVTDALIEFYEDLAGGGAGLIISGNVLVHTSGRSVPQQLCIHNDFYIEKLKRLTDAVHKPGGSIIIQLVHGGRQSFPALLGGEQPLAPSVVFDPSTRITPRAMKDQEIWEMIESFGNAARRAVYAGFDGVQLHAAHGYLINEFLSPYTNRRDDYWGGDEERRFHFVEEICRAIRSEAGESYPLLIKMNADDCIEGGLAPEESVRIAKRLEDMGLCAFEVSGGMYEARNKTVRTEILNPEQEAYFRSAAGLFKRHLRMPVMLVGGLRSRRVMEDVLLKGDADLISLSRPLIREPDLPHKMAAGKEKADCISCNGCMRFNKLDVVRCTQIKP
ncbi:MAG TPA: NADH:flavin oxidoreductase [Dissulfurispiraceae bacterium]|nr:NADH:flavin oxidoreductase [Dissulfurispiraceae bacterium]